MRHGDDEPMLHRETIPKEMPAAKLDTLRVLAYDTRANKLVNVSIPMWLLRMAPTNKFSFMKDNGIDFDSDRVHITLDDLERRGPGTAARPGRPPRVASARLDGIGPRASARWGGLHARVCRQVGKSFNDVHRHGERGAAQLTAQLEALDRRNALNERRCSLIEQIVRALPG